MGLQSKENWERKLPLGKGVMLAVLHSTGKLPTTVIIRKTLASLGAKKIGILSKNIRKYYENLSQHEDWDLLDNISEDLKAK